MSEITALLEQLASEIGVGVDYLWPLLVKQTVVLWWSRLACGVGAALLTVGVGWVFFRLQTAMIEADYDEEDRIIPFLVVDGMVGLASFTAAAACFFHCATSLDWLFVPEAATIQRVLGMLQ